jgi:hypothetical protein
MTDFRRCCIDKSSSAELSEAINSMYRWYQKASICYVHLADASDTLDSKQRVLEFMNSRWFTRGWSAITGSLGAPDRSVPC